MQQTIETKTALIEVVKGGNLDIVSQLIDTGATINSQDNYGRSALMVAIEFEHEDIIKLQQTLDGEYFYRDLSKQYP